MPCRICMSDGTVHEVHHPELVAVATRAVFIALPLENDQVPDEFIWCDPVHITQIQPLRKPRRANRRTPKKP